jgi:subtilase family serine protease
MFRPHILITSTAVLAMTLTACGGGGGSHTAATPVTPPTTGGPVFGSSANGPYAAGQEMLSGATLVQPANLGAIHFQVQVKLQNAAGLGAYADAVSDPKSPLYRQFLGATEIGQRFGASADDYKAAATYLASYGLKVGGWKQRLALSVTGDQASVERALGTTIGLYRGTDGGLIVGPTSPLKLSQKVPIVAIAGLVEDANATSRYRAMVPVPAPRGQGNNFSLGYTPQQIATAFDFTGAYRAGYTGKGVNLGIIGTGPVDPADIAAFKNNFSWSGTGTYSQRNGSTQAAAAQGGGPGEGSPTATPPPVTGPGCRTAAPPANQLPQCNPEDAEAQIDTEQALLAPDANTLFYITYVAAECQDPSRPGPGGTCKSGDPGFLGPRIGLREADDSLQQAINDNDGAAGATGTGPDILSLSYGGTETGNGFYYIDPNTGAFSRSAFGTSVFAALAVQGVAVFISSGDSGAQGCARPAFGNIHAQCVSWPAVDPDVVSVGGVTLPLDNAGRYIGPMTGWGYQTNAGSSGSGGGVSKLVPKPAWETGLNVPPGNRRVQPDASLDGDGITGVATFVNSRFGFVGTGSYGGTSVAAPQMAAMWALVLDACRQTASCRGPNGTYRLGNPAPLFYRIFNNATQYPQTFYDVTFGNTGVIPCLNNPGQVGPCPNPQPTPDAGFDAGTGFDLVTGVGVPFAGHLINAIVNPANPAP